MIFYKIYKKIIRDIDKLGTKEEKFNNMYLLTCLLIFNLSNETDNLDVLLKTFKEFDYKKNFGYEEKDETK
ncbi:MAG: hypothetical protein IKV94_02510 [Clostridia bacterium]|nr:hypothetical protein [Clostridia bacterium]MBR6517112.1 hypothetical protein [Bacilli bacterium]